MASVTYSIGYAVRRPFALDALRSGPATRNNDDRLRKKNLGSGGNVQVIFAVFVDFFFFLFALSSTHRERCRCPPSYATVSLRRHGMAAACPRTRLLRRAVCLGGLLRVQLLLQDDAELLLEGLELLEVLLVLAVVLDLGLDACSGLVVLAFWTSIRFYTYTDG